MPDNLSDRELLYDPMFAKKPPTGWEDSEKGGIFGKAVVKKTIFIIFLCLAIGTSLFFSFRALGKEKYIYTENDVGYELSEFNGSTEDRILYVEYTVDENGAYDKEKPVTSVREFAVCCNENLEYILIGKDVESIAYNGFYYCTNLKAVIADKNNPHYTSVDGVLYNKDKTEIILHPIKNNEYRAALAMGFSPIRDLSDCERFMAAFTEKFDTGERSEAFTAQIEAMGGSYEIPATVKTVAPYCFSYCSTLTQITVPEGVTAFGDMAFFKCTRLTEIYLPDSLLTIGADAVSYCNALTYIFVPKSVTEIGHHAFFDCLNCDAIYMEAENEDQVITGESWIPKQSNKTIKTVPVIYGAKRGVM